MDGTYYLMKWKDNRLTMEEVEPEREGIHPLAYVNVIYGIMLWAVIILLILGKWVMALIMFGSIIPTLYIHYKIIDWWEKKK